jgi:hypothetical protein
VRDHSGDDSSDPATVLFIAGWGRTGSTLLERMLAEVPGVVTIGELFQLWGRVDQRRCACGSPLRECTWWDKVLTEAFGAAWPAEVESVAAGRRRAVRHRCVPRLLATGEVAPGLRQDLERYVAAVHAVQQAAARVDGATVVVDASKSSLDVVVQGGADRRLRIVHMTRDPRGVAASWKREDKMMTHNVVRSAVEWDLRNGLVEVAVRRFGLPAARLDYEELVADPEGSLRRVTALAGLEVDRFEFVHGRTVELGGRHAIGGNPGRTRTGTIDLRLDEGWRDELTTAEQAAVGAIGWPLWSRYRRS